MFITSATMNEEDRMETYVKSSFLTKHYFGKTVYLKKMAQMTTDRFQKGSHQNWDTLEVVRFFTLLDTLNNF